MILKKGKTNWKYILIIVVLATIVGSWALWNSSGIEVFPISIVTVKHPESRGLKEGGIVFDVYYTVTEAPLWYEGTKSWIDIFTIPRLIDYKDKGAQTAFNDFIQKHEPDLSSLNLLGSDLEVDEDLVNSLQDKYEIDSYDIPEGFLLFKNELVSIASKWEAIGGAHPVEGRSALNYDLKNKKEITLDDILEASEEELKSLIKKKLLEEVKNEPNLPPEVSPDELPCSEEELNISGFYLTDTGLAIMVYGHRLSLFCQPDREFFFTFDELNGIIKKDGPISRLRL